MSFAITHKHSSVDRSSLNRASERSDDAAELDGSLSSDLVGGETENENSTGSVSRLSSKAYQRRESFHLPSESCSEEATSCEETEKRKKMTISDERR